MMAGFAEWCASCGNEQDLSGREGYTDTNVSLLTSEA